MTERRQWKGGGSRDQQLFGVEEEEKKNMLSISKETHATYENEKQKNHTDCALHPSFVGVSFCKINFNHGSTHYSYTEHDCFIKFI